VLGFELFELLLALLTVLLDLLGDFVIARLVERCPFFDFCCCEYLVKK